MKRVLWLLTLVVTETLALTVTRPRSPHVIHYFNSTYPLLQGNMNFALVNQSCLLVDAARTRSYALDENAYNRVVFIHRGTGLNYHQWALQCERVQCTGLIFYLPKPGYGPIGSATYRPAGPVPFTTVPIAFMYDNIERQEEALLAAIAADSIRVSFASTDIINPIPDLLKTPLMLLSHSLSIVANLITLVIAIYKLLTFAFDREGSLRPIPLWPLIVFVTQILACLIHIPYFINAAFFSMARLPYIFYRYCISGFIPIALTTIVAVALAMHEHLYKGQTIGKCHLYSLNSAVAMLLAIFIVDQSCSIMSAVLQVEVLNTDGFAMLYFLLNIPCCVMFIKFGGSVARMVLANEKISALERERSVQFARRVRISGMIGVSVLFSQIAFITMFNDSSFNYLFLYNLSCLLGTIEGLAFVTAFKAKPSVFDVHTEKQTTVMASTNLKKPSTILARATKLKPGVTTMPGEHSTPTMARF